MAIPTGVNGITGFVVANPQAPPFEVHGGPANPYHGHPGEHEFPYPWITIPMGPYPELHGPQPGMVEDYPGNFASGMIGQDPTADQTPAFHAAPFPNEGPGSRAAEQMDMRGRAEGSRRQLLQSLWVHAQNTGASLRRLFDLTYGSKQDTWVGFFNPVQGEDIVPIIPGSVSSNAGGFGANDHTSNAYHKANTYGLNTSHRHRRYATGHIPGNFMWMNPSARPLVRSFTGQYKFQTSGAFAGDDPGFAFSEYGAILHSTPSQYTPPPVPNLGNAPDSEPVPNIPFY